MTVIVLVYGNHGLSPVQIDDHVEYLFDVLGQGNVRLSEKPVPGAINILIECFADADVQEILEISSTPGTRLVCLATEFITSESFNFFGKTESAEPEVSSTNAILRRFHKARSKLSYPFDPKKRRLMREQRRLNMHKFMRKSGSGIYDKHEYWKKRFDNFCILAETFEAIWCLDEAQFAGYAGHWGDKVKWLPIVALSRPDQEVSVSGCFKDIDFLFTGTITEHRKSVLDALGRDSVTVAGPATWSALVRNHFVDRSRVCLDIRQSLDWKFSSSMRLHKLLRSRSVIAVEKSANPSLQEECIGSVPAVEFVEYAQELRAKSHDALFGRRLYEQYYERSQAGRTRVQNIARDLVGG